ncbi:MAG: DUF1924 domain-containing protein [Oleibacter sp.]|nr:DUF1924 domain-containing protein [Thalassolituus sp.]
MKLLIHALLGTTLSLLLLSQQTLADANSQLDGYRQQGAGPFSAEASERLWSSTSSNQEQSGRSCTQCHGKDPAQPGKHIKTGKVIEPMAVRSNPQRFSDAKFSEKWFLRNCKWTLGRECSAQEKGDVITWLNQY